MLRVVTTNNAEIFRHFGSKAFQAVGVEQSVGTDFDALLELVRTKRPQVAILDIALPERDGFELCRAIKDDPALAGVRVMLALTSVVSRQALRRIDECGCDDVLALPVHTDDFHHHLAQVVDLPYRRNKRIAARLGARFDGVGGAQLDHIEDLSLGGVGAVVRGALAQSQRVTVEIDYDGHAMPAFAASVSWIRPAEDGLSRVGLRFVQLPIETRIAIEDLCLFDVVEQANGRVTVGLHGDLEEHTDFTRLAQRLERASEIDFDMREIRYMSSIGVRGWVVFIGALADKTYTFRHASLAFTSQVSMMPSVAGKGRILSFEAPYRCESCDRDDLRLLETRTLVRDGEELLPPTLHCGVCRGELVFDDIPWRYLGFAR